MKKPEPDNSTTSPTVRRGRRFALVIAIFIGALFGTGAFTFIYADGHSYLTNDPTACANCHIMQNHLEAWNKSTHRAVATCNDCHAPHDSLVSKLWVKGRNGFNHSLAFTTGRFDEPIRITPANRSVTEATCRYCHAALVHPIDSVSDSGEMMSCIRCHGNVGHPDASW
ncbi:MAG: cytochrome c nitrite reductase small subunit [Planctomycetota bacterium]|nr:cytochrome c nitrite reductase small subunit [Planctomycetota bacterium]